MPRVLASLALVLVAAVSTAGAQQDHGLVERIALVDLDGTRWDASRFQGRVTLLDFWATWCAPCLVELPYLKRARQRFDRDEFEVLGISFDVGSRRAFVSWLNRQRVDWPQVFDGRGARGPAARLFQVSAIPASLLIDPEGRIVARDLRGERLMREIERHVTMWRSARRGR